MYSENYKYNYLEAEEYKLSLDDDNIDIFIIEKDIILSNDIKVNLEKYGYTSEIVKDFQRIIEEILLSNPKLIIIDIDIEFIDISFIYKKIRKFLKVPVIFLIDKDFDIDTLNKIKSVDEYYILKPFSINFLVKKVQSIFKDIDF